MTADIACDVAVIGSGASGMAAAVAAARAGADVVLLERNGFLGGLGTGGAIGVFCGLYSAGERPAPIASAFGWTVVGALLARGAAYRSRFGQTLLVHYDPEELKRIYDQQAAGAGVRVLNHSLLIGAERSPGGGRRISAAVVVTPSATLTIAADAWIDASGDAALCFRAGVPTEQRDADAMQPATLVFRMAGVDIQSALELPRAELNRRMRDANRLGRFALPRASGSFSPTVHAGEVVVNMTRIRVDGTNEFDLTRAELEARAQVAEYARWLIAEVPGFASAYVSAVASHLGLRETRRLRPRRALTAEDLRAGRRWPDELGEGAWPFEVHSATGSDTALEWLPDGVIYGIPVDAALPPDVDNLWVIGRCLGATAEAHASTRVMGTCFSSGEVAGNSAAAWVRGGGSHGGDSSARAALESWRAAAAAPPTSAWPRHGGIGC